jgi:hypothetical protein
VFNLFPADQTRLWFNSFYFAYLVAGSFDFQRFQVL